MEETPLENTSAGIPAETAPRARVLRRRVESDLVHRVSKLVAETAQPFAALVAVTQHVAPVFRAGLVAAVVLGEGVDGRHLALSDPDKMMQAERLFAEQMADPGGWLAGMRSAGFVFLDDDADVKRAQPGLERILPAKGMTRLLVVPFLVRGTTVGGLMVARGCNERPFDQADMWLAESVADILALAIGVSARCHELDQFFAASLELRCIIGAGGHLHRMNPQWEHILGYEPVELEGALFQDLVHPDDRATTAAAFDDLHRAGVPAQFVSRLRTRDGSYRALEWVARSGTDLVYACARDVTERLAQEQALQESQDRYRLIADNVADVIWILDLGTMRFSYVSPSVQRLRGYTPDEIRALDIEDVVTPESYEKVMGMLRSIVTEAEKGEPQSVDSLEIKQPHKDGGVVSTEIITRVLLGPDGKPAHVLGVSRDITQRIAAEAALRDSRKRIEDLMFVVGDWVWEVDAEYRYTHCSAGVRAVLGYEPWEVVGRTPWDFMTPRDATELRSLALERAARKEGCSQLVNHNLHRDGHEVVLVTSCVPIIGDSGELLGYRGIDKDITVATQTQESLRRGVVELHALWQIAETVAGPEDLHTSLSSVAKQVSDAMEARFALVVTFGEGGEGRHMAASTEADTAWCEDLFLDRAEQHMPGLARIAAAGEPVVINDLSSGPLPPAMGSGAKAQGFSRLLLVPLVLQREVIGTLAVTRSEDGPAFEERDVEFAQAAAGSMAAAVVHARLRVEENLRTANQVRDHLARELHDAVTQSVYSASLIAQALPAIWKRSPDDALAGLAQMQKLVRSALAELRILLYELRPGSLAGVGLDQLLERLGDSLAGQADVTVDIKTDIDVPPPQEVKEALYRIAQEAFNNIAKHARATNVLASVVADQEGAVLRVEDDGIGVDVEAVEGDHHGLAIMRERAEEIGAGLRIDRMVPSGTRLTVEWAAPTDVPGGTHDEGGS